MECNRMRTPRETICCHGYAKHMSNFFRDNLRAGQGHVLHYSYVETKAALPNNSRKLYKSIQMVFVLKFYLTCLTAVVLFHMSNIYN